MVGFRCRQRATKCIPPLTSHIQNEPRLLRVYRSGRPDLGLIRRVLCLPAAARDLALETSAFFLPAMRGTVESDR